MLIAPLSAVTALTVTQGALEHKEATRAINNKAAKEVATNLIVKPDENLTEINKLELVATTFFRDEAMTKLLALQAYNASLNLIQNNPAFYLDAEVLLKEKERSNPSFRNKTRDIVV